MEKDSMHALVTDLVEQELLEFFHRAAGEGRWSSEAEAPSKAPPILHARRLHAYHTKVEHRDAPKLIHAHLAGQRLDRAIVCAISELLGLYQVIKFFRAHGPAACRSLCFSLTRTQVQDQLPFGMFEPRLLDLLGRATLVRGPPRVCVADGTHRAHRQLREESM
eukprot:3372211-Prymnesium_polylepis.1